MKPKWQRAQFLDGPEMVWVTNYGNHRLGADGLERNGRWRRSKREIVRGFGSNVLDERGIPLAVESRLVELLPDFAEDVPLVSWQDFLESCRKNNASQ